MNTSENIDIAAVPVGPFSSTKLPLFFKKKRKLFLEFKIMFQSSFVDLDEPKSAFPLCLELVEGPLPPSFWLQIINCIPFRLFF